MPNIRAGEMNRRVTLQVRSTAKDSYGAQSTAWTDVATIWAAIEALSVREQLMGASLASKVTHTISTRFTQAVADVLADSKLRIVYGSRVFDIEGAVNVDERNFELRFTATEGASLG